jgi:hypothetical protein
LWKRTDADIDAIRAGQSDLAGFGRHDESLAVGIAGLRNRWRERRNEGSVVCEWSQRDVEEI